MCPPSLGYRAAQCCRAVQMNRLLETVKPLAVARPASRQGHGQSGDAIPSWR
jgi:hypothetical protein